MYETIYQMVQHCNYNHIKLKRIHDLRRIKLEFTLHFWTIDIRLKMLFTRNLAHIVVEYGGFRL